MRAARITDRQALVELSRRVHTSKDSYRRSLGVPAPSATLPRISMAALIPSWLPLRPASLHLVAEADGELVGSCRAIEEPPRGLGDHRAGRRRRADGHRDPLRAPAGAGRGGGQRNVARFHAACSDVPENMELFGQLGFMAYAQEGDLLPPAGGGERRSGCAACSGAKPRRATPTRRCPTRPCSRPARDAWHLFDLWSHATPPAIARIEDYQASDWESVSHEGVVPRSSLNPLLHFSGVNAWFLPGSSAPAASSQHGSCRGRYLRFLIREGTMGHRSCGPCSRPWAARRWRRASCRRCEHMSRPGCAAAAPASSRWAASPCWCATCGHGPAAGHGAGHLERPGHDAGGRATHVTRLETTDDLDALMQALPVEIVERVRSRIGPTCSRS